MFHFLVAVETVKPLVGFGAVRTPIHVDARAAKSIMNVIRQVKAIIKKQQQQQQQQQRPPPRVRKLL